MSDCQCGHGAEHHCDYIGRCNVMVHTPQLALAECNCPQFYTEEKI